MSCIEKYRHWYEQEKWSNDAMLRMLASVPEERRSDSRYARALVLAAHLAACRENWLERMTEGARGSSAWWPESATLEELGPRFEAIEARWTSYLAGLSEEELDVDFEFPYGSEGKGYRWNIEGQIVQLVGHAFYHRGQIAMIVEELGGEHEDTDFLYWEFQRQPERWHEVKMG